MKPQPKRKIQAQRKFAQGYVPPNPNQSPSTVRPEASAHEAGTVVHITRMTADSLLDRISLQSLVYIEPRVLLHRLRTTAQPTAQTTVQPTAQPTAQRTAQPTALSPSTNTIVPATIRRTLGKVMRKYRAQKITMRLRSKTTVVKGKHAKVTVKSTQTASDSDDEQPLHYFRRLGTRNGVEYMDRSEPADADNDAESMDHSEPAEVASTNTKILHETDIATAEVASTNTKILHETDIATAQVASTNTKILHETDIATAQVASTNTKTDIHETDIATARFRFRKPASPLKGAASENVRSLGAKKKARMENRKRVPKPLIPEIRIENHGDNGLSGSDSVPEQSSPTSHQHSKEDDVNLVPSISSFPSQSVEAVRFMDSESNPDGQKNLRSAVRKLVKRNELLQSFIHCPSKALLTVRQVLDATDDYLSNRCGVCKTCNLVEKVCRLKSMVHRRRDSEKDVYDLQENLTESTPFIYRRRQQTFDIANPSCTEGPSAFAPMDDDLFYFDILPASSNRIIEFRSVRQPQALMKARIVPKPDQEVAQDLNLVEHEIILDQLLQYLNTDQTPPPTAALSMKFPKTQEVAKVVDAPTYHLTEAEFTDPILFYERIAPSAARFGLCKVVPPGSFKPECVLGQDMDFRPTDQYIPRLYNRWGPTSRELCAIKATAAKQKVTFGRAPLLGGLEVNLAKLYHVVQRNGGLKRVIEKKRWTKVAEDMRLTHTANAAKAMDKLYMKYLLPYDTLSSQERQEITKEIEKCWSKRNTRMHHWALNPLHSQKKILGESDSSSDESDSPNYNAHVSRALMKAEDGIVAGRPTNLAAFKKLARNALVTFMPSPTPRFDAVEEEYWRLVLLGAEHVCVQAASIDTGDGGFGFSQSNSEPFGHHPWNLKMFSKNPANVLRSLGAVLGVTVPTLHLGMVFATSCWHRDPHGLPWVEFMHEGPTKIWYGIPKERETAFRAAVESLCPTLCQNKSIWLPSDITMIPPSLLCEHRVSLSRVEQKPGEFVIVFPKAYSCSISTGYTVSESVYFATNSWLKTLLEAFQELRDSCEPSTFSMEHLLISLASDERTPLQELTEVHSTLVQVLTDELSQRRELVALGVPITVIVQASNPNELEPTKVWNVEEQDECQICRKILYLSKVTGLIKRKATVCLQHALHLLRSRSVHHDARTVALLVMYSESQLNELIENMRRRISS